MHEELGVSKDVVANLEPGVLLTLNLRPEKLMMGDCTGADLGGVQYKC